MLAAGSAIGLTGCPRRFSATGNDVDRSQQAGLTFRVGREVEAVAVGEQAAERRIDEGRPAFAELPRQAPEGWRGGVAGQ